MATPPRTRCVSLLDGARCDNDRVCWGVAAKDRSTRSCLHSALKVEGLQWVAALVRGLRMQSFSRDSLPGDAGGVTPQRGCPAAMPSPAPQRHREVARHCRPHPHGLVPALHLRKVGPVVRWIDMDRFPFKPWQGWPEPRPAPS